jgi:hypothetical protein
VATLAPNLDAARHSIWTAFPGTVVGWIGDAAHMASCSDHNEDDCGVVHAIDPMTPAGTEQAKAIVNAAVGRPDVEYVIHNRTIWSASHGWAPRAYTGSDPHTSHVHLSGRHGSACYSGRTCTGYDHAAEHNTTPWSLTLAQGPTGGPPSGHLDEDGVLGPMTISAWQRRMGTPVDGFITQPPGHSDLVRAVQVYLNRLIHAGLVVDGQGINQDGHSVFSTTRALQRHLGTARDGVLSLPRSQCVQALQRRLNAGTF